MAFLKDRFFDLNFLFFFPALLSQVTRGRCWVRASSAVACFVLFIHWSFSLSIHLFLGSILISYVKDLESVLSIAASLPDDAKLGGEVTGIEDCEEI